MQIKEKLEELENSNVFIFWKKANKDSYLAHIFRLFDEANKNIWQFGYYNTDDTITTFIMDGDCVNEVPQQEIFKKDSKKLLKLDISKIKKDFEDAVETAKKLQGEKYSQHPIMKTIAILQKTNEGNIFNITFVTQTFGTLNIHVAGNNGEVKFDKFTSIMDLAKFEKGERGKKDEDTAYIG